MSARRGTIQICCYLIGSTRYTRLGWIARQLGVATQMKFEVSQMVAARGIQ